MAGAIQEFLQAQPRSGAFRTPRRDTAVGTPSAPNRPLPRPDKPLAYRSAEREEQIPTDRQPSRRSRQTAESQQGRPTAPPPQMQFSAPHAPRPAQGTTGRRHGTGQDWTRVDKALRATDLLLQTGGFSILVLDLGSVPAEIAWRIPQATWFRFRAACDRTRTSLLLLTQHSCARSSAALVLSLEPGCMEVESKVFSGMTYRAVVERERFPLFAENDVLPLRKPPQRDAATPWKGAAAWAL